MSYFSSVQQITLPENVSWDDVEVSLEAALPETYASWVCNGIKRTVSRVVNTPTLFRSWGFFRDIFAGYCHPNTVITTYPTLISDFVIAPHPTVAKCILSLHRSANYFLIRDQNAFVLLLNELFAGYKITMKHVIMTCGPAETSKFRKFLHNQLSRKKIEDINDEITNVICTAINKWGEQGTINLTNETKKVTAEVISRLFLGYEGDFERLADAIEVVTLRVGKIRLKKYEKILNAIGLGSLAVWCNPKELEQAYKFINDVIDVIIEDANDQLNRAMADEPTTLIEQMVAARVDPSDRTSAPLFSSEELRAMVFTLFLGGQDTTANTLNYILLKLAQDPQLQQDIRSGMLPLKNVIAEGIRMMPAAGFLGRLVKKDLMLKIKANGSEILSCRIQKGAQLLPAPAFAGRNPQVIPDQDGDLEKFDPYRWNKPELEQILKDFLPALRGYPFGLEKHQCPGSFLAKSELEIMLTEIVNQYDLSTDIKGEPRQETTITARPYGDLWVKLTLREDV